MKKVLAWVAAGAMILAIGGCGDDGGGYLQTQKLEVRTTTEPPATTAPTTQSTATNSPTTTVSTKTDSPATTVPIEQPAETNSPESAVPIGQRNAAQKAKEYLNVMPFSHSGLVKQLEYEGFTPDEAVYGADNCGADWYAQAVKAANSYLELMPFSREELIGQLEFEGFTREQAEHGAATAWEGR